MSRIFNITILLLILSSCNSAGHQFCLSSGHAKGSSGYEQCTAKYEANQELYKYCQEKRALTIEGNNLDSCINDASNLRNGFNQDRNLCGIKANNKFSNLFNGPKQEKQPTLTANGDIVVGSINLASPYNESERGVYLAPYLSSCMTAHGWYNVGIWQEGQQQVAESAKNANLKQLDNAPVNIIIPEHQTVALFGAVAAGNVYEVKNLIQNSHIDVNIANHQGYTALHVAARRGNFEITRSLIEELGANIDAKSNTGESVVALASYGRHSALVNYITEYVRKKDQERIAAEQRATFLAQQPLATGLPNNGSSPVALLGVNGRFKACAKAQSEQLINGVKQNVPVIGCSSSYRAEDLTMLDLSVGMAPPIAGTIASLLGNNGIYSACRVKMPNDVIVDINAGPNTIYCEKSKNGRFEKIPDTVIYDRAPGTAADTSNPSNKDDKYEKKLKKLLEKWK